MKQNKASEVIACFEHSKEVIVIMHTNPDGDAVGATLAIYHYLHAKGKKVRVMAPDPFPDFLAWMPGASDILVYERDPKECNEYLKRADLLVCADFNTPDRLDIIEQAFEECKATKVLIDHHIFRGEFCDVRYTDTEISSTAELFYRLLEECGEEAFLGEEAATCLYVGIMTDTGSFSYACNYKDTFRICSQLIKLGIDAERTHRLVYDTYSESRLRLLGFCLSERLNVMPNLGTAWIALSNEDLGRFGYKNGDTEGVVNYTLGINGIVFGALITERKDKIKISLRSKGSFDVNRIAREHFNGGGHKNAAGGDMYCSFDDAVRIFKTIIPQYADELKAACK